jgi:SAM-dependent methyltransferase
MPTVALSAAEYDARWLQWDDCVRFSPGFRHRRRLIRKWIAPLSFWSCLDVGCGNAELLRLLKIDYPDCEWWGVDLSPEVIQRNLALEPGMCFESLDIERKRLDRQFDLILCSEVIEHLDHRPLAIENMARMLTRGGHLLVTCPLGRVFPTDRHMGHTTHPELSELMAAGAELGLVCRRLEAWGWPFYNLFRWSSNLHPEWTVSRFATGRYNFGQRSFARLLYALTFLNVPTPWGHQLVLLWQKP